MGHAAHWLGQFNHLFEGNVLIFLRGQSLCLGLLQQFSHAG